DPLADPAAGGAGGPGPAAEVAAYAAGLGLAAAVGGPEAVAGADVVVCCTTARTPLFDGRLVPDRAVVAAVGSHEPDAREVDARLVARADLFVEARQVALREAGDLLLAGAGAERMANLAELVTGRAAVRHDRPRFFKSVGMAWQDLAVAAAQYASAGR
ncbi:ornithine cyclodeaminase family protein, partial [Kitasatospora cineracea]